MIPQTGIGRFLFFLHIALIAAQWLLPLAAMSSLPDQIPVHFDFHGNPERFASKHGWETWFGPIIGTIMGIFAVVLLRFPSAYNVPGKADIAALPPPQRARLHDLLREMMLTIFVIVQAIFLSVTCLIILFASGMSISFAETLIPAYVATPLIAVIVYLARISRALREAKREAGMAQ